MTNKPFFSIITCTKNSEKYLPACLSSLASQNFTDYEHIVIDGYSVDKTLSLIPKTSHVYQVKPSGISTSMNEGIKRARGQYLYFLHSDDALCDSKVLSDVAGYLRSHPSLDWAYGQIQVIDENSKNIGIFPKYKIFQLASSYLLKFFNFIPHQATFVKKSVFDKYGSFDTSLKTVMDYSYWLKICKATRWSYMSLIVANYRIHQDAQSSALSRLSSNQQESQDVQNKYLNPVERSLSQLFNLIISKVNKTTR